MGTTEQPPAVMRRLWQRMSEIFGPRWTSAFGEDAGGGAGQTWAKGLAGLTVDQVAAGVEAVIVAGQDWPPMLPVFRAMCLGIPPVETILDYFRKTAGRRDPSGFERLVWSYVDGWTFARARSADADAMIRAAYGQAREFVLRGGQLPPDPIATLEQAEPEPPKPSDPAVAEAAMARIAAILCGGPTDASA